MPSDLGSAGSRSMGDVPQPLRSALLDIMQFGQGAPLSVVHMPARARMASDASDTTNVTSAPSQPPRATPLFGVAAGPSVTITTKPTNFATVTTGVTGACGNFQLDLSSAQFGMCRCGFDRNSHGSAPRPAVAAVQPSKSAAYRRNQSAPPPPSRDGVSVMPVVVSAAPAAPLSNSSNICGSFQLDMNSAQFGMCRCGFDRNSHNNSQSGLTAISVSARAPRMSAAVQPSSVKMPQTGPSFLVRSASTKAAAAPAAGRFANVPAPTVYTSTAGNSQSETAQHCGNFQLDMSSAQFGMCRCGFDRNAHNARPADPAARSTPWKK